jgi:hypothetical protein
MKTFRDNVARLAFSSSLVVHLSLLFYYLSSFVRRTSLCKEEYDYKEDAETNYLKGTHLPKKMASKERRRMQENYFIAYDTDDDLADRFDKYDTMLLWMKLNAYLGGFFLVIVYICIITLGVPVHVEAILAGVLFLITVPFLLFVVYLSFRLSMRHAVFGRWEYLVKEQIDFETETTVRYTNLEIVLVLLVFIAIGAFMAFGMYKAIILR